MAVLVKFISIAKIVVHVVFGLYVIAGFFHSLYFDLAVSPVACLTSTGLVAIYCHTGIGISHLVNIFWTSATKS
jgi:hypothetical protein